MATQQLAIKNPVLDAIERAKPQFSGRLPEGITIERFHYGLATSIQKNPALLKCDPRSVLLAAYEAAECGCDLSPSRALGWLIPYGNQAQFQPSYRHFIQLAYKSKCVKAFNAEVVYSKDKFKIVFAPVRTVLHQPNLSERGEPVGAYALVEFVDGHIDFEFLSLAEINNHRQHSKQPNSLMWKDFWGEGARKTAIRVLSKRLPQENPAMEMLAQVVEKDSDLDVDKPSGIMEMELDSPLAAEAPKEPELKEDQPQPEPIARPIVNFYVGKLLTFINGQTRPIESEMRKLLARRDEEKKCWTIPSSRTEEFLAICEQWDISAIEVNEQGEPAPLGSSTGLFEE